MESQFPNLTTSGPLAFAGSGVLDNVCYWENLLPILDFNGNPLPNVDAFPITIIP